MEHSVPAGYRKGDPGIQEQLLLDRHGAVNGIGRDLEDEASCSTIEFSDSDWIDDVDLFLVRIILIIKILYKAWV